MMLLKDERWFSRLRSVMLSIVLLENMRVIKESGLNAIAEPFFC